MVLLGVTLSVLAFGTARALSLEDLKEKVENEESYRGELINYLRTHNITMRFGGLNIANPVINTDWSDVDISEMEKTVLNHMEDCRTGVHQRMTELWKNYEPSNVFPGNDKVIKEKEKLKNETLAVLGDC
jgi:hypothetical protein